MFHLLPVRLAHPHALRASVNAAVFVPTLLALSASIQAKPEPRASLSDPLDPTTPVPALVYRSSLTASKPPPEAPTSWRQANDTVTGIGGWRAYARQAQQSAVPEAPKPPPSQAMPAHKAMPAHLGHGAHSSP
jgi:hypothetical protein